MSVTVELTYEMAKALGVPRFEVDGAGTVAEVVTAARDRFKAEADGFENLTRVAAVAVNGVLISHKRGMRTPLRDGDRVAFVKAAAGG